MPRGPDLTDSRPRVLVTGFGPFPGAPENPTQRLIEAFSAQNPVLANAATLHLEVLPVEYGAVPRRLIAIGREFAPHIAVHFGLSDQARGFTLERLARNEIRAERPDNTGEHGKAGPIHDGARDYASSLPLTEIERALSDIGAPVYWSDDAGGYLCNYLFYLSCGHFCSGFTPTMSGFIHVPLLGTGEGDMTLDDLKSGAVTVIETCCRAWKTHSNDAV